MSKQSIFAVAVFIAMALTASAQARVVDHLQVKVGVSALTADEGADISIPAGGPVTAISYGDSVGPALQAGADVRLNKHWAISLDVRKIWINTDVKIQAGPTRIDANVDIDPWVSTVGVGYRF